MIPGKPRILLVEGQDDKRVIPELIEGSGVPWGPPRDPIVEIVAYNGITELLSPGEIETHLKASGLRALGVIVDADDSAQDRWSSVRARIVHRYPDVPELIPEEGLVTELDGIRFGTWVMPDNVNRGMLETFLMYLRPMDNTDLHDLAKRVVDDARNCGAPFRINHCDKAQIHSWLSWQDPPGQAASQCNHGTNANPQGGTP